MSSGTVLRQTDARLEPLHRQLAEFNRLRLQPLPGSADWQGDLRSEIQQRVVEGHFLDAARADAAALAVSVPSQPQEFADWFEGLREAGAQTHSGLWHWLAEQATRAELSWFLAQELATDEVVEDLMALTQLSLPWRPKLELARCYWDEVGQGQAAAMRARILEALERELRVELTEPPVWECVARSNLMVGLASNRRYAFHSIGALGARELMLSGYARSVAAGLKRLDFSLESVAYFQSRGQLELLRSHAWNEDVILPLVAQDSRISVAVAEGALMRLAADARCTARYNRELRLRAA
jgi:hypothetical protein